MGQSHSSSSSPSRPSLTKTQSLFLSLSKTLPPLSLRDYNSIFSSLAETNDIGVPTYWKEDTFTQFLKVPPRAGSLLFKSARYLAALPNLEDSPASLDLEGLGVAVMVYTQRIPTEVLTHQEVNRVLFNSFAETPPKAEPSSKESEKEIPHGKYSPYISLSAMNEIILFLLSITTSESFTSSESAPASTDPLDRHVVAQSAKSILSAIRSYSKTLTEPIYYDAFRAFLERDAPYFFDPLVPLFQKFLYDKQKWGGKPLALEGWTEGLQVEMYTKTMNVAVVAQLSTFFPKEKRLGKLVCLYAGSKNGFSMGMFETKVLKYPGPSVLLLRGTKHPVSENATTRLTLENFGDTSSILFQLCPTHTIFPAARYHTQFAYFHRQIGIGFGSPPPTLLRRKSLPNATLIQHTSDPQVSLSLDSALEHAVFSHIQPGSSFQSNTNHGDYAWKITIDEVEVWGCGLDNARDEQKRAWEYERREAERRQSVRIREDLAGDRALLELAGVISGNRSGGSV